MMKSAKWFSILFLAVTLCFTSALAAKANSEKSNNVEKDESTPSRQKTYMKRKWGVEVLWVRETAGGYMLEFRYKVLDAKKAAPLFERKSKPILTHEKTGSTVIVPTPGKVGALRNSNTPKEGTVYWMFFANPGKFIKPGDLVSIQIGEYLQPHLVVE